MCSMAAFCQRLRGTQGDVYAVDPSSVSLTGSGLTAKLANRKSSAQFKLQLTSYEGTVRLHIDEEPSQDRCVHCRPCLGLMHHLCCCADGPMSLSGLLLHRTRALRLAQCCWQLMLK